MNSLAAARSRGKRILSHGGH